MKLNYSLVHNRDSRMPPVILLHGLFGSLDNLGSLARSLQANYSTVQVDLRNHGLSPHSDSMSYELMAQDVLELLDQMALPEVQIIGHSMGGKVAMALTGIAADRITHLAVLDIAPVAYLTHHHDAVFAALQAVSNAHITQRSIAAKQMATLLSDQSTIQFLLKSFYQGSWRFNLPVLQQQYPNLIDWQDVPPWPHPVLFIKAALSSYIQPEHQQAILRQFPLADIAVIADSGHWVHGDKPQQVLQLINTFLAN